MFFERIKKPREDDSGYLDLEDYSSELEKGFSKMVAAQKMANGSAG
jgi:hypothetical protein